MHHQQPASIGGLVDGIAAQPDPGDLEPERQPVAEQLVMIARYVGHLGAIAGETENEPQHLVMRLVPVPGFAQPPAVDDVADEVEVIAGRVPQEVDQEIDPAAPRAEMQVGNENTAVVCPAGR